MHDVVVRAGREHHEPRRVRVDAPRDGVLDPLHELQGLLVGQDEVELDAGGRHHEEVGDRRPRPLEVEDPPPLLRAAPLAQVRERVAEQQVEQLELDVGALDRDEAVVEREAHVLHLAAVLAADHLLRLRAAARVARRRRERHRHKLLVLDQHEPARRLVEAHLRVALLEIEDGLREDVGSGRWFGRRRVIRCGRGRRRGRDFTALRHRRA